MRGIAAAAFTLLLLLASRAAVRADEPKPPPTIDEAAAEVAKAFAAKDQAGLAALAKRDQPDPWQVADALMLKGQREAADAFARAAPREDVKWLPDFISTWRDNENDKAARATVDKINAAIKAKRHAEGLAAAEAAPTGAMPYLRLRCSYGKGLALANLGRNELAADTMRGVAVECEVIGWYARAAAALWEATYAERRANRPKEALAAAEQMLALHTRRGDRLGVGIAHVAVGSALGDADRWEEAYAAFQKSLEPFRESGDRWRQVVALNSMAWAAFRRGNAKDLEDAATKSLAISEPAEMWGDAERTHQLLGDHHRNLGELGIAAARYRKALEAARKAEQPDTVARLHFLIGQCLSESREHEQALEPFQQSITGYGALVPPNMDGVGSARAQRAMNLAVLGRIDEARPLVEQALEQAKSSKDPWVVGTALRAQGRLLRAEKKLPEAVAAYEEARKKLGAKTDAGLVLVELAETHLEAKDLDRARASADAAVEVGKKSPDRLVLFNAYAIGARIRRDQGHVDEALTMARDAHAGFKALGNARGVGEMDVLIPTLEAALTPK